MPPLGSDLLIIERAGVRYKASAAEVVTAGAGLHATMPGLVTGAYVAGIVNASALTTIAALANRIDFMPFVPARSITVNELALEVTTLIALAAARIGIYADASGVPGALIIGSTANLDCTVLGVKTSTIASTTLTAGTVYWLAVHSSLAPTYRGIAAAALMPLAHNATANAVYTLQRGTATFGTLPATAPSTTLTASVAPWVRLKIA